MKQRNEMERLVAEFPRQIEEALELGNRFSCVTCPIDNVVLAGLGGSAFGGEVVKNLAFNAIKVPYVINRGYELPAWVGSRTLVILSSYSGNTEETLSAAAAAKLAGALCVCVTHGGKLADFARENGYPIFVLPAGYPPRAAAGFSVVAQFFVLARFGLLADDTIFSAIREGANALRNSDAYALAEEFADLLYDRVPVLYAPDPYECVAVRFRQQINENAKMLCWHHVVPEMNHNELVGWEHPAWLCEKTMVVFFRGADEHPRHAPRFDFTRKVVDRKGAGVLEIHAVGPTPAARVLYLIHLCDHISTHLARLNGADPTPVAVIDELKAALAR